MAITTKNGSKNKKAKLRRPVVKTSPAKQAQTIAELRQQLAESLQREEAALKDLQDRDQQLAESLRREQLAVRTCIYRKNCGIDDVVLRLHEGNTSVLRAHFGPIPIGRVEISTEEAPIRWIREHGTLHIPDESVL